MPPQRRAGELTFALALLAFALAALWQAHGIAGFSSLSSAGVFPMLAAATMAVAALAIAIGAARRPPADDRRLVAVLAASLPRRLVLLLALVAAFLVSMPWLGFLAASGLFLFAAIALLWRRGIVAPALVTAVALAMIWITFRLAFQVVLPRGTLLQALL